MEAIYISAADTAKLVRQALKKAFPGVKFSVRSHTYSGGASVRVRWTDGPTVAMVEPIAKQYQGGGFDGMIDLKYSYSSWLLPDGSAAVASNEGTQGSMGTVSSEQNWMPHPEAKLVRFCADFVFCDRDLSERFLRHACARLARQGYQEFASAEIEHGRHGGVWLKDGHRLVESEDLDMATFLHRASVRLVVA